MNAIIVIWLLLAIGLLVPTLFMVLRGWSYWRSTEGLFLLQMLLGAGYNGVVCAFLVFGAVSRLGEQQPPSSGLIWFTSGYAVQTLTLVNFILYNLGLYSKPEKGEQKRSEPKKDEAP